VIAVIDLDTSGWTRVGATSNVEFFTVEPGILALVPQNGAIDGHETALENMRFLNEFGRRAGRPVALIVFFDRTASLDGAARKVYNSEADPTTICGAALIGGSMLGRAVASVFLAIVKPKGMRFQAFEDYEEAIAWARVLSAAQGPDARQPPAAQRS
jgi:hypothetical protein